MSDDKKTATEKETELRKVITYTCPACRKQKRFWCPGCLNCQDDCICATKRSHRR